MLIFFAILLISSLSSYDSVHVHYSPLTRVWAPTCFEFRCGMKDNLSHFLSHETILTLSILYRLGTLRRAISIRTCLLVSRFQTSCCKIATNGRIREIVPSGFFQYTFSHICSQVVPLSHSFDCVTIYSDWLVGYRVGLCCLQAFYGTIFSNFW